MMLAKQQQTLETHQAAQIPRLQNSGMVNNHPTIGSPKSNPVNDERDEEMTKSALSNFRAKEEEIEKRKTEVKERVQARIGLVEEETKRLAEIREELEGLHDPMRKEVAFIRKRVDLLNRDLKPLGLTCQKKIWIVENQRSRSSKRYKQTGGSNCSTIDPWSVEIVTANRQNHNQNRLTGGSEKEYKEALEAFNEKNREKGQLIGKLVELVTESEKLRLKKLDELSKNIDSLR
ncbi:hypothetical protein CASFOL_035084 [Castilleja foliolosa]|uniref:RAB6-interacting golgin n=1 Tax=Castilleja foliolosa TaxID=1961234 RepID=A0ABD3BSD3_9LAMI